MPFSRISNPLTRPSSRVPTPGHLLPCSHARLAPALTAALLNFFSLLVPSSADATYAAGFGIYLVLYLLDVSHWPPGVGSFLRKLGTFVVLVLIGGGGLLTMADFPYLPLAMAMLLMPFGAFFLVGCLFPKNRIDDVRPLAKETAPLATRVPTLGGSTGPPSPSLDPSPSPPPPVLSRCCPFL